MKNKKRTRLGKVNKKYVVKNTGRLLAVRHGHARLKWSVFYKEILYANRLVDLFLNRSIVSVFDSYLYRKNKGIKTRNIYSYDGDSETYRLLNRSMTETLKESFRLKKLET